MVLVVCLRWASTSAEAKTPTEAARLHESLANVQEALAKIQQDTAAPPLPAGSQPDAAKVRDALAKVQEEVAKIQAQLARNQQGSIADDHVLEIVLGLAAVAILWRAISAHESNVREGQETQRAHAKKEVVSAELRMARDQIELLANLFTRSKIPLPEVLTRVSNLESGADDLKATIQQQGKMLQDNARELQEKISKLARPSGP